MTETVAADSLTVVGVRFKRAGKIYYFDPAGHELVVGDYVLVETGRGLECGQVVVRPRQVSADEVIAPLRKVVRVATPDDLQAVHENARLAEEALGKAWEVAERLGLSLRLVSAEYTFDRKKLVFHFTAEEQPDLRGFTRELAGLFRSRIELRQIGARDEAKIRGGLGPCGRILCCTSFLSEFEPVSIKMAKEQELALNPSKLTGLCGRLKCCLRYENDTYVEARALLPPEGATVRVARGRGRVIGLNFLERRVKVLLEDATIVEVSHDAVRVEAAGEQA